MVEHENSSKKVASSKINFKLKSETSAYDFTLSNKDKEITFKFEDLNEFPVKIYELVIDFDKLREQDENLGIFKRPEKFIDRIKTFIQNEKYAVKLSENENMVIFEIKNELFEDGVAIIKIPEKKQDLETQVESLTKTVSELRKELQALKVKQGEKDEAAVNSFKNTSFLKDEEKKMISKWIHPNKIIRFNLIFSTDKDNDYASTFHYYCDGVFPTVTVVLDNSGRRFGGYSTQNWCLSTIGGNYSRAPESFIFSLTNKQKYELIDQLNTNTVYRNNSYGPTFGNGYDLCLANQCKSNSNSYCNKCAYNTGNTNLLGLNGQTNFQVSNYEVYKVIFE